MWHPGGAPPSPPSPGSIHTQTHKVEQMKLHIHNFALLLPCCRSIRFHSFRCRHSFVACIFHSTYCIQSARVCRTICWQLCSYTATTRTQNSLQSEEKTEERAWSSPFCHLRTVFHDFSLFFSASRKSIFSLRLFFMLFNNALTVLCVAINSSKNCCYTQRHSPYIAAHTHSHLPDGIGVWKCVVNVVAHNK